MSGTKLKARIRPESRGNNEIDMVHLELMNPDGSPYSPGGGSGGEGGGAAVAGQIIQGQLNPMVDSGGWTLTWDDPGLIALGIDLSEYVDSQEVLLPRGMYISTFDWYIDPGVDEGAEDLDRGLHFNIAGSPGDWLGPVPSPRDWSVDKGEGSWAEALNNQQHIVYPFAVWADHQTAQIYATSSASDPAQFTINLMIAKIADLPEA